MGHFSEWFEQFIYSTNVRSSQASIFVSGIALFSIGEPKYDLVQSLDIAHFAPVDLCGAILQKRVPYLRS